MGSDRQRAVSEDCACVQDSVTEHDAVRLAGHLCQRIFVEPDVDDDLGAFATNQDFLQCSCSIRIVLRPVPNLFYSVGAKAYKRPSVSVVSLTTCMQASLMAMPAPSHVQPVGMIKKAASTTAPQAAASVAICRKSSPCAVGEPYQRQHHRNLDQHAHHRDQRRTRVQAKQTDGHGDRQFKEV